MNLIKYVLNSWLVDGQRVTDLDDVYKKQHRSRILFPNDISKNTKLIPKAENRIANQNIGK